MVGVEYDSAVEIKDYAKPWSNRDYTFIHVPEELIGLKYYQYEARSNKGVTLDVKTKTTVKIIVGGWSGDLSAITKWENEGWEKIESKMRYGPDGEIYSRLHILSKDVNEGTLIINDYSEFAGIIVLTR